MKHGAILALALAALVFQGECSFSQGQESEHGPRTRHVISKRGAVRYRMWLWPAVTDRNLRVTKVVIPYTVKTGFWFTGLGATDRRTIREAAAVFEKYTCLRFVERAAQRDYVEFFKENSGICESYIGRKRGKQTIALGSGCRNRGHITHEIMHTLGFYHEHTRPDRDRYVRILWDNIKPGNRKQFEIRKRYESTSLGQPYDFRSIMHYQKKEFSKNGKDTIQALKDPTMELGSINSLSAVDIMQINLLYKCPQAATHVDNFHVTVFTGRKLFSGTDAKVFVELYGVFGGQQVNSGEIELNSRESNFESGGVDKFNLVAPDMGRLRKITVRHNNQGRGATWYLDKVHVRDDKRNTTYIFPCSCWLRGQRNTKTLTPLSR